MKYVSESFNALVKKSYAYDPSILENEDYKLLERFYVQHYLMGKKGNNIPKIIHQIWLGGELPEKYKRYTETWKKFHPDWDYFLWTDCDAEEFPMRNRKMFNACKNLGQKSDIFRYEILNTYGGLYIDTDFECLKPFDDLLYLDFFTSLAYAGRLEIYNGLIACTPHHPIMETTLNKMKLLRPTNSYVYIFESTGCYHFARCILEEIKKEEGKTVVFPMDFFYPYPNNKRFDDNAYDYVREFSYAIHHWAVSWTKSKRK